MIVGSGSAVAASGSVCMTGADGSIIHLELPCRLSELEGCSASLDATPGKIVLSQTCQHRQTDMRTECTQGGQMTRCVLALARLQVHTLADQCAFLYVGVCVCVCASK